jgi:hypothetical protein
MFHSFTRRPTFRTGAQVVIAAMLIVLLTATTVAVVSAQPGPPVGEPGPPSAPSVLPVGSMIPWHKNFAGSDPMNAPALPAEWVEANGQTITDPDSPFDGTAVPDLNGQGLFVRGAPSSGGTQTDQVQGHKHLFSGTPDVTADRIPRPSPSFGNPRVLVEVSGNQHLAAFPIPGLDHVTLPGGSLKHTHQFTPKGVIGDPVQTIFGPLRIGSETRPVNFSVVWIIKIK